MEKTLKEINDIVRGEIFGDPSINIMRVASIDDAKAGDLAFALDVKHPDKINTSKASAFIVPNDIKGLNRPHIKVTDPRFALALVLRQFEVKVPRTKGIHSTAIIDSTAKISKSASIMAYCVIGKGSVIGDNAVVFPGCYIGNDCRIGDETVIHSNISIYDRTQIGKRCILHSGVVIGSDGFGFAPVGDKWEKIPQLGNVIIEDDVELNANVSIAKATLGSTIIKNGTKIDNLTHIAHNCVIGANCAITAGISIAGSSTLGSHVVMGGMSGVSDHVNVGDNSVIMAKAGVTRDFPANSVISGFPGRDHKEQMEILAAMSRLPGVLKKMAELEKKLKEK